MARRPSVLEIRLHGARNACTRDVGILSLRVALTRQWGQGTGGAVPLHIYRHLSSVVRFVEQGDYG
jgi:hypothetical protein